MRDGRGTRKSEKRFDWYWKRFAWLSASLDGLRDWTRRHFARYCSQKRVNGFF
jgi:hypothetical protein